MIRVAENLYSGPRTFTSPRFMTTKVHTILSDHIGEPVTFSFAMKCENVGSFDINVYAYQGRGVTIKEPPHLPNVINVTHEFQRFVIHSVVTDHGLSAAGESLGEIAIYDSKDVAGELTIMDRAINLGHTDGIWTPAHADLTPEQIATLPPYGEYKEIKTF